MCYKVEVSNRTRFAILVDRVPKSKKVRIVVPFGFTEETTERTKELLKKVKINNTFKVQNGSTLAVVTERYNGIMKIVVFPKKDEKHKSTDLLEEITAVFNLDKGTYSIFCEKE